MSEGMIGEAVHGFVDRIAEIRRDIALTEPLIRDELMKLSDKEYWDTVCHGIISNTLEEVPEGTHLFQCSWNNRQLFNDINAEKEYMAAHKGRCEFMIANDMGVPERRKEVHPEIMVNIARVARFSMNCPYGETDKCPRHNFQFDKSDKKPQKETIE